MLLRSCFLICGWCLLFCFICFTVFSGSLLWCFAVVASCFGLVGGLGLVLSSLLVVWDVVLRVCAKFLDFLWVYYCCLLVVIEIVVVWVLYLDGCCLLWCLSVLCVFGCLLVVWV